MMDFEEEAFGRNMPDGTVFHGNAEKQELLSGTLPPYPEWLAEYAPPLTRPSYDRVVNSDGTYSFTQEPRLTFIPPQPWDSDPATKAEKESTTMATAEQRKTLLKQQMTALQQQLADVQKSLAELDYPEEPPAGNYSIVVRFPTGMKNYEYLLKKLDNGCIFTTGTGESGRFQNWKEFLDWLRGNVRTHSCLTQLSTGGRVWLQTNEALR